jgi:hypothetical protein
MLRLDIVPPLNCRLGVDLRPERMTWPSSPEPRGEENGAGGAATAAAAELVSEGEVLIRTVSYAGWSLLPHHGGRILPMPIAPQSDLSARFNLTVYLPHAAGLDPTLNPAKSRLSHLTFSTAVLYTDAVPRYCDLDCRVDLDGALGHARVCVCGFATGYQGTEEAI